MTNNSTPDRNGLSAKTAGRLSMISTLAISAVIAAAPAQAQSVIAPSDLPASKMQMQSPVAVPPPAPAPPIQSGPVESAPVTPDRADDLATKGGFDATTVAPEALAQIESEQQARKTEAAKADTAKAAATARARTASAPANIPADSSTNDMTAAPIASATGDSAPVAGFDSVPPVIHAQTAPAAPEAVPTDQSGVSDWNLLAALAALLGIGGAGVYAASRRRKDRTQPPAAAYQGEPEPDPVMTATMPELRREPVEAEARSTVQTEQPSPSTKADFAAFVGGLPAFEAPRSKADHNVGIAQRRVAAAPRPYLGAADLSRRPGYFTAHVDGSPTPQNPFLSQEKRLKRAQYLDSKLAEMKAANAIKPTRIAGTMQTPRPLRPAYG